MEPRSRPTREGSTPFDDLFREHYEPMVRVAFLLLGSRDEAEDVVQDAFARVELRWRRLGNPGGYLRRCEVVAGLRELGPDEWAALKASVPQLP